MQASIIITTYKDPQALGLILDALILQTHKGFEVIIAEDEQNPAIVELLSYYDDLDITHCNQPDTGRNKLVVQNKAILTAKHEYLIFIDGDCIPYTTFIEAHLSDAKKGCVLTGRRINLTPFISKLVRNKTLNFFDIEYYYFVFALLFILNRSVRIKQGFYFKEGSFLYKLLNHHKRTATLLGSNFSCTKADFVAINGFDEGFGNSIIGQEDTDIDWRFKALGCEMISVKNRAIIMHLYHPFKKNRLWSEQDKIDYAKMIANKKANRFVCEKGLNNHYN